MRKPRTLKSLAFLFYKINNNMEDYNIKIEQKEIKKELFTVIREKLDIIDEFHLISFKVDDKFSVFYLKGKVLDVFITRKEKDGSFLICAENARCKPFREGSCPFAVRVYTHDEHVLDVILEPLNTLKTYDGMVMTLAGGTFEKNKYETVRNFYLD